MGALFVDEVKRQMHMHSKSVLVLVLSDNDYSQWTPIMEIVPGPNY